jgi:hypothetical protein
MTHMEMIKGIKGHGYRDELVIPIIENTPYEYELTDSLAEAVRTSVFRFKIPYNSVFKQATLQVQMLRLYVVLFLLNLY